MNLPIDLQGLVDVYDQPFLLINQDRQVVLINRAFEETYDIPRSQAAEICCHALVPHASKPCPCGPEGEDCPFPSVFDQQATRVTTSTYRDAEGREHVVRVQAYPLHTGDGEAYVGELVAKDEIRHHPGAGTHTCPEGRMVGESPMFRQTLSALETAAGSNAPILLQGETGTGKELAASFIHRHSPRRDGPFETLDCSALTEELFESEVFGHERGAFTGSVGQKPGLFELADKGTLFLDEIGELSLALQAKLLRVLESGTFRRVGGTKTRKANVRIISATNRQLRDADWFRNDLFYRVACITVQLPSLSERRSDIPVLAEELLKRIGQSAGRPFVLDISAQLKLLEYDYPGNVRELRNILWVAAVNSRDGLIQADQISAALPEKLNGSRQAGPTQAGIHRPDPGDTPSDTQCRTDDADDRPQPTRRKWEAEHLELVLRHHKGNRRAVAAELGISERTVYRKIKQFGLS